MQGHIGRMPVAQHEKRQPGPGLQARQHTVKILHAVQPEFVGGEDHVSGLYAFAARQPRGLAHQQAAVYAQLRASVETLIRGYEEVAAMFASFFRPTR